MKPTQQEIIELASEAGYPDAILEFAPAAIERLVHLALEHFGAGGGEPVAWMYFESDGDAIFGHPNGYRPDDAVPVYTRPSPTDLRAEYLRGLEDAAKVADDDDHVVDGRGYYDQLGDAKLTAANIRNAIEALKGKQ